MEITLFAFLISLVVVAVICAVVVIIKQIANNKKANAEPLRNSDNCKMLTEQYSGKYSMCKKIGEANTEF